MIAALLAAVTIQTGVRATVLELPDPEAPSITIHAYLMRDGRYEKEDLAWQILGRTIGKNSRQFSASDVLHFGSQGGFTPRTYVAPAFIRFESSANPNNWSTSIELAVSAITEPNWRANFWEDELKAELAQNPDPWRNALWPRVTTNETLTEAELENVHARNLAQSGVIFIVSGPFERGQAKAKIDQYIQYKQAAAHRRMPRFERPADWPESQRGQNSTFEVRSKPILIGRPGSAQAFLAAIALGVGKDSVLWQKLREESALAYRVEGIFWPSAEGFVPRFLMLRGAEESELKYTGQMIDALRGGIEEFDEDTLVRAKAMARQILKSPSPFASVYLDSQSTLFGTPTDDVRWRGLLFAMGADSMPLDGWIELLDQVELDGLKSGAQSLVDSSEFYLIRGQDRSASN